MIGKFLLFFLATAACSLIGLCNNAVAATKNVDIVVTHGAGLNTTYTLQNTSGRATAVGQQYIGGMVFRRGDVRPGQHVVIRDASTHTPLAHQQWDEISTRREFSDDNSWRHGVFSIQVPNAIPAGGKYTVEFVTAPDSYSPPTDKQTLVALCAAHDFNIRFTDVMNQDGSQRDSGAMTFRVCDNISNTGRFAPTQYARGDVRSSFVVRGQPVYDTTGHAEPQIYVEAYLDLMTNPNDQNALGQVRHVFRISNPWMTVRGGSAGYGAGPVGFTNDPQAVIYYPQVRDGTTVIRDWSAYNTTIDPALSPNWAPTISAQQDFFSPSNVQPHPFYAGMAVKYIGSGLTSVDGSATQPCLGDTNLINGHIYFAYPYDYLTTQSFTSGSNKFKLTTTTYPYACDPQNHQENVTYFGAFTGPGSGIQQLAYRVYHRKFTAWFTTDENGATDWTGSPSKQPFEIALDTDPTYSPTGKEQRSQWVSSGVFPPLNLASGSWWEGYGYFLGVATRTEAPTGVYAPLSMSQTTGGSGGGQHADVGPMADWTARAFLKPAMDPSRWKSTRMFALQGDSMPNAMVLNEATGRIPIANNGPPVGNGGGQGDTYAGMGANFPHMSLADENSDFVGVTMPRQNSPINGWLQYVSGPYGGIRSHHLDHWRAFANFAFMFFGDRHLLDISRDMAGRAVWINFDADHEVGWRRVFTMYPSAGTSVDGVTFYGSPYLWNADLQGIRAMGWADRDLLTGAIMGSDNDPERAYFADIRKENANFWFAMKELKDCSGTPSNPTPGSWSNGPNGTFYQGYDNQVFMQSYVWGAIAMGKMAMRDPFSVDALATTAPAMFLGWAGPDPWPTSVPSHDDGSFDYNAWRDNRVSPLGRCKTAAVVGDRTEYWTQQVHTHVNTATGLFGVYNAPWQMTLGDRLKNINFIDLNQARAQAPNANGDSSLNVSQGPTELAIDGTYYCIRDVTNYGQTPVTVPDFGRPVYSTFRLSATCPGGVPGSAITSYTGLQNGTRFCYNYSGTDFECPYAFGFRMQNSKWGDSLDYLYWGGSAIAGAIVAGVPGLEGALANIWNGNGIDPNAPAINAPQSGPSFSWDPKVIVP
jgi:hypothetical protein